MASGLPEMLHDEDALLDDSHLKTYGRMLLSGVAHMHATNIMHRVCGHLTQPPVTAMARPRSVVICKLQGNTIVAVLELDNGKNRFHFERNPKKTLLCVVILNYFGMFNLIFAFF